MPQALQLGRYHLLDRIAFGGMAEIFRAKTFDDQGHVHFVAVKRVLPHLVGDGEFLQMLVDEAKISAMLNHRNIARVYELAQVGDDCILVMEFIDGKDVRALLERARQLKQRITPEHIAWIGMEVATALYAAHTLCDRTGAPLNLVHRDISPSNVMCSYAGDVKLCDFGIAKATLSRVQTRTGVIKGKVKYMSPEQAMGRRLDHRSDLFSLGTVLYELITLTAPFSAPSEVELIFVVRDAQKIPVLELCPDCPPRLAEIVEKLTNRSRSARYQSGEELALDLRLFLDSFRPGYRRSNFARYMRRQFEREIDKELRILEDYTIAPDSSVPLGVNLIADALEPDALVTRFTPILYRAAARGGQEREKRSTRPAFNDAQTLIFQENQLSKPGDPVLKPGDPAFHNAPTEPGGHSAKAPPAANLHEQETHIFSAPAPDKPASKATRPAKSNDDPFADEPSVVVLDEDDLEEV